MHRPELQSYWRFMHENLFDLIDIEPANVHLPNGEIAPDKIVEHCAAMNRRSPKLAG